MPHGVSRSSATVRTTRGRAPLDGAPLDAAEPGPVVEGEDGVAAGPGSAAGPVHAAISGITESASATLRFVARSERRVRHRRAGGRAPAAGPPSVLRLLLHGDIGGVRRGLAKTETSGQELLDDEALGAGARERSARNHRVAARLLLRGGGPRVDEGGYTLAGDLEDQVGGSFAVSVNQDISRVVTEGRHASPDARNSAALQRAQVLRDARVVTTA